MLPRPCEPPLADPGSLGGIGGTVLVVEVRWSFRDKDAGSASRKLRARPRTQLSGRAARARRLQVSTEALLNFVHMARRHLIGLLLATEEDWPSAFEAILDRLGPVRYGGEKHELEAARILNEPVRPPLEAALHACHRPSLLVVRPPPRVAEEDRPARRRLPPQQPVHVPGNGEARRLLRDDAPRPARARDLAAPAQAPAGQPALRADGRAVQPRVRPRADRRVGRLSAP